MLEQEIRNTIVRLLKREVTPTIGCTEPISVALKVAKVRVLLAVIPKKNIGNC